MIQAVIHAEAEPAAIATSAAEAAEDPPSQAWETLCRTADLVRADGPAAPAGRHGWGRRALLAAGLVAAGLSVAAVWHTQPASADGGADADLFALTNQDRASNGVPALVDNSTLSSIGENAPYSGCSGAGTVSGRAQDMINRDYFSHQIPPCGQYVWPMMTAYGVDYRSAGENIGWVGGISGADSAAQWINNAFMNSPDHRANILDPSYTDLGTGSAQTASGQSWTCPASEGCQGSYQQVWIFAEEFAQLAAAPKPTPTPTARPTATPKPAPASTPTPAPQPTSTPAPSSAHPSLVSSPSAASPPTAATSPTPVTTTVPTPSPNPAPTAPATSSTVPAAALETALPALDFRGLGLISDTIESTLEAFLFD